MATGGSSDGDGDGNAIAEKRRQRKLENQRLEAAARQRQEELLLQKERELKRLEDERIAAERRRLEELEQRRKAREAELEQIAGIEKAEKELVANIERRLKLIVLSSSSLETSIPGLDETVVIVGDDANCISAYRFRDQKPLFRAHMNAGEEKDPYGKVPPTSLATTRSGYLIVCSSDPPAVFLYDISLLVTASRNAWTTARRVDIPAEPSLCALYTFAATRPPERVPRLAGVAVDDLASEVYVTDKNNHSVIVLTMNTATLQRDGSSQGKAKAGSISFTRSFGAKGHGRGCLRKPGGLDVSHYHVLICDRGNHRITVFNKRGAYVCAFGGKGRRPTQFMDPRDVKLANVRKRALTRGVIPDSNTIANEQFDVIVADEGNYRLQILNEGGEFVRVLSLLSGPEQIQQHQNLIASYTSQLLQSCATINVSVPTIHGSSLEELCALALRIHPSCRLYQTITRCVNAIRQDSGRFHHPVSIANTPKERVTIVVDRRNGKLLFYNLEGSQACWMRLPTCHDGDFSRGLSSVHTCLQLQDRLYVTDPNSHRVGVFLSPGLEFVSFIGASSYGSEVLCAGGVREEELRCPTYLASFKRQTDVRLLIANTGNNTISVFDPTTGKMESQIGGGFGRVDGHFDSPQGITVFQDRWLYACDQRNHRIQIFDLETSDWCRTIGGEQGSGAREFSFPQAIAVCGSLPIMPKCDFGPFRDAKYCVGDVGNHRVQVLSIVDDSVIFIVDEQSTPFENAMLPCAVSFEERSGYFLVTDMNNRSVAIFRNDGSFVYAFGGSLEPENCFQRPTGFTWVEKVVGGGVSHILVTDSTRHALCEFKLCTETL